MALYITINPTVGQQYTDPNNVTWEFNGTVWNVLVNLPVGATGPEGATGPQGATGLTGATGPAPTFDLDPITAAIVFGGGGLDEASVYRSSQRIAELEEQIQTLIEQQENN
jgi:hypothetical protein